MKTVLFALLAASSLHAATQITWKRQQLHADFYSEGAAIGDINGDGKPDVVAGPFWWEGPAFEKKHAYYEPKIFSINGYSDNFFAYVHDFNADKRNDILILGFPGKEARLYLNPGTHDDKPWPMHIVADVVDNESPVFTDITGDGKPEIVCSTGGKFGYFAPNWEKPMEKWPFVYATDDMKVAKFTHGLGVGDVNGDGQMDLLEARRWWENTGSFTKSGVKTAHFIQHNFAAGVGGGAQMFAYDFDGNGTNDVFTALAAHRYGVAVYLQNKPAPDKPTWNRVMLASEQPQDNDYGIVFSQPHAAFLADIDGDGIKDIVTGKRYWAHNGHDPDEHGHRVIYWYQTKRDGKGGVDFVPHLVDAESGVGVDVQVGDVNGDTLPDIVVGNKAGVFILTQERKDTTADLTPKKLYGPALKPQAEYAKGQSPADALESMQLPGGFKAELIAAEPDLVQPMAFTFDERGRIWVVEGNSYPQPREVGKGQDRIKILEDQDGDGTFETKKTFCEGLNLVSGIELGFGGVWVGAAPYLMFIPDKNHDDRADPSDASDKSDLSDKSFPQVPGLNFTAYALLDGWGTQDTHETLNSFIWGPDGWLYGCHGVFTHSRVGKPGTPDDQREPINAGVWRYHPVRHEFEVFAHGTSNPWGLDYDQHGEWFVTACVIPHLYHIVPGGRYHRQAGQHFNAHTYEDIKTIADHAHYAGNPRPDVTFDKTTGAGVMNNDTNALGGGHAHCGLAIYQSSLFPPTYRNQLLFGNLHGHRLVANYTDPHASTYIGKHAADFLRANDMHFIPVTQRVGPDGALYVSDWSDQQICHRGSGAVEHWDRSNGRLYRISYDGWKPWKGDLAKESDASLAKLAVQTENEWESRMARRVLMEHQYRGDSLKKISVLADDPANDVGQRLRALWTIAVTGFHSPNAVFKRNGDELIPDAASTALHLAGEPDEHLRAWRMRLAGSLRDFTDNSPGQHEFVEGMAIQLSKESSPIVRSQAASFLQRIPIDQRKDLATALLKHGEDKDDPMIPLLIWYGIEPVVAADPAIGMQLAKASKIEKVTGFIYRRLSAEPEGRNTLLRALAGLESATTAQPENKKGGSQPPKGGGNPKKGPAKPQKVLPQPGKKGADSAKGGSDPEKGAAHLPKVGGNIQKVGTYLPKVDGNIPKVGTHLLKVGGDIQKVGAHFLMVGAHFLKLGPPFPVVSAHFLKVGAPFLVMGAQLLVVSAPAAAVKADSPAFSPEEKESILASVVGAAKGAGKLAPPADWPAIAAGLRAGATPRTLELVQELAALFGEAAALDQFRATLADAKRTPVERQAALSLLIQAGDAGTAKVLQGMLADTTTPGGLRRQALQALASLKDAETPKILGALLPKLPANELPDAINTLASTKEGAKALLKAVEAKTVPSTALSPFLVRQLTAFDDAEIAALIKSAWGDVNAPKADMAVRVKKYRDLLTPAALAKGDAAKGKTMFMATCGACHKLFGEGQNVGPDITGSNRADLGYLLENVLDPNAVIGKAYQLNLFTMKDGRVMIGVIKEESAAAVKIAMMGGVEFTLPVADIAKREVSKLSTMPEGLFDALPPEMVVDVVKYLQSGGSGNAGKVAAKGVEGALEGETLKVIAKTGGNTRIQGMGGFGNRWSGGAQLWWVGGKPDQKLTLALPVKDAGKYQLHGVLTMARDYGVMSITLDGKPVASTFDGYHADKVILTDELDWGTHELTAGDHQLTFTLAPPNPAAAPGNMVGLDYVRLERK
jgi:putative membrane-bound dehydrogenase-like protein